MRSALVLALLVLFVVTGCAGGSDPSHVVRAWAKALRADDNERAASLFARDAVVIQGDLARTFHTHQEAVAWNAHLPCSGRIVELAHRGSTVTATFRLADSKRRRCGDPPGAEATAVFVVEDGKIVLWVQTGSEVAIH